MAEARQIWGDSSPQIDELWRRQWMVASTAQLRRRGLSGHSLTRAVAAGRLFVVHRHIYSAIPADLLSIEGLMAAAILLGGKGAALCEESAAWWLRLQKTQPALIHVATRHAREPADGIRWHRLTLRPGDVGRYRGLPTTSPRRTLLDNAVDAAFDDLLQALAEAEYHHDIEATAIKTRQGHPGAANLQRAIKHHTPQLAATRSELERAFVLLLRKASLRLPLINHPKGRATVDAIYEEQHIAIELDGVRGHTGERRILRDHRRDLHRRADGYRPLRYHYSQITREPQLVLQDLVRAGVPPATSA